jgi:drug/metabolite transporter (DMT)-like permease
LKKSIAPLAVLGLMVNLTVWGLSWMPFKSLQAQGIHPLWATCMICASSIVFMLTIKPAIWRELFSNPQLFWLVGGAGLTNAFFNTAVAFGDVVRVVLLFYLMPIWSVLLAWPLLGEAITSRAVVRISMGLAGAMLVLYQPAIGLPLPVSLADWAALAGGASFALNNIMLRKLHTTSEAVRAFCMFAGAMLLCGVIAAVLAVGGSIVWPVAAWKNLDATSTLALWSVLFLVGNLGLQYGAARLPANITAVIMLGEILVAAVSAWWLGSGQIRIQDMLGGVLIIAAPWLIRDVRQAAVKNA